MAEQVLNQFRSDKTLRDDCVAIYEALGMDLNTAFYGENPHGKRTAFPGSFTGNKDDQSRSTEGD